jgi:hypothetical protein
MRDRRFPRGARRSILWAVTCLVTIQLTLMVLVESRQAAELRDPEYGIKISRLQYLIRSKSDHGLMIVMLGSSRTGYGFKASDLESVLSQELGCPVTAFNFGIMGAGPITELMFLKRLFAAQIKPDFVILEVFPTVQNSNGPGLPEQNCIYASRMWADDWHALEQIQYPTGNQRRPWWMSRLAPVYSARINILKRLFPNWLPLGLRLDRAFAYECDDRGWTKGGFVAPTPEQRRRHFELARIEFDTYLSNFQLSELSIAAFRSILAECTSRDIPAVFIAMPETTEYRGWCGPEIWNQLNSMFTELANDHPAPTIDARGWLADADFRDAYHIAPVGAAKFTERLGVELLPTLMASQRVRLQERNAQQVARFGLDDDSTGAVK